MKKILLIVLLSFSLNASGVICEEAEKSFKMHFKLMLFAFERMDGYSMKEETSLSLKYIERAIASCDYNAERAISSNKIRSELTNLSKTFK